jgi:hypothetical protein
VHRHTIWVQHKLVEADEVVAFDSGLCVAISMTTVSVSVEALDSGLGVAISMGTK